ncbi:MAG TPA: hypothetical protein ENJ11_00430, partial [Gammaproteobacteria bacterium]|nr:hypothetical protein [Gammaproteobacteria bacterium]
MMIGKHGKTGFTVLILLVCFTAQAAIREYIRDYKYQADDFDTRYTSRVCAIDGVKQNLLEELGTYVQSVINISESSDGSKSVTHDYVSLTAGILRTELLEEDWDRVAYYVKARMQVDPDEVRRMLAALKNDVKLEQALRESEQELAQARKTIRSLQQQMKRQKDAAVLAGLNREYVRAAQDLEVEFQYQRAIRQIVNGQFDQAFSQLKELADKNYPAAQAKLGHMYERGMGMAVDYDKAAQWYLKAIKNGNVRALAHLGFLYERGLGVRRDLDRARELYQQAADSGDHSGQSRLAMLYLQGRGVEQDPKKAMELARASVSRTEHGRGYALLGFMYDKGIGVDEDLQQAAAYYEHAARRGNPQGMARLAWMYARGRGVMQDTDRAWALIDRALRYNNSYALMVKGYMYEKGLGVDGDREKAVELYRQSADQETRAAMYRLGIAYEKGRGVEENVDEAISWYRR